MTAQRFYMPVTGTVDANGHVVMTFPSVPQSSVWTGSVSLYAAPLTGNSLPPAPVTLVNGPLAGSMWWLLRNQSPICQMGGAATAHDVQLVAQEVLSITGWGLTPGDIITAVWSGYAEDAGAATIVYPMVSGSTDPYVAVYNGNGPGGPLDVVVVPDPSRTVAVATGSLTSSTLGLLIPASSSGHIRLLSVSMNLSAATDSATVEEAPIIGTVQLNDSSTITPVVQLEAIVIQAASQSVALAQELHELPVLATQRVELATTSFVGTGSHHVNATVVYSYVPLAP